MKYNKFAAFIILSALAFASCKPDEKIVPQPQSNETLTTTILRLVNIKDTADHPSIKYQLIPFKPLVVTPDSLILKNNATYTCTVIILNDLNNPADTVSNTIKQRANEHLFVYRPSTGLMLTDSITDHDTNVPPLPFGLQSQIKTGNASRGVLELILRHQPNVKNGTYPPGDTDLDVIFPVKIQ
jgi:hypothetical protein